MIAPLLEALQEKDPATYKAYRSLPNAHLLEGTAVPMAWLQVVLQESCQERGWAQWTGHTGENAFAEIHRKRAKSGTEDIKYGHGDSPAEALLRCYLEAIG